MMLLPPTSIKGWRKSSVPVSSIAEDNEVHRDGELICSVSCRSGRSQSMGPILLLAHCILGKFLVVVCHLGIPLSPPRASASAATREIPAAKDGTLRARKMSGSNFA